MLVNVQLPARTKAQENIFPNLCTTVERKQKQNWVDFREKRMMFLMPTHGHNLYVGIRTATVTHNTCVMEDDPLFPSLLLYPPPYHLPLHASAHAGVISSVAYSRHVSRRE